MIDFVLLIVASPRNAIVYFVAGDCFPRASLDNDFTMLDDGIDGLSTVYVIIEGSPASCPFRISSPTPLIHAAAGEKILASTHVHPADRSQIPWFDGAIAAESVALALKDTYSP